MKKIILLLLLASCSKADVKPVANVTTVDNIGIDTTKQEVDKKRKIGHERPQ